MTLVPGLAKRQSHVVTQEDLALNWGGEIPALASPVLMGLLEKTCALATHDLLPNGKTTVGVGFDVIHLAPTPSREVITLDVTLTDINGKQLQFTVEAHDSTGMIFSGTHIRGIVDRDTFLEKLENRLPVEEDQPEPESEPVEAR